MTPFCTLLAATLLAAQAPLFPSPADGTPLPKPAQVAVPKPPQFRAAGVAATVGEMRREQKSIVRRIVEMSTAKRQAGLRHRRGCNLPVACSDRVGNLRNDSGMLVDHLPAVA